MFGKLGRECERLAADLAQDRPSFRRWIGGFGDRPAHNDVAGAGRDGFGWGDHTDLVPDVASSRADPRGDQRKTMAELGSEG